MTIDRDQNLEEGRPIQVSMQPPGHMGTPARRPAGRDSRPTSGIGTVLASGALAFLLGGAGAWVYLTYLDPILASQRPVARQAVSQEAEANPATTKLVSRVEDLSSKLDRLRTDVDHVSRKAAPPDLEPINTRLSALEGLPSKVQALDARVSSLPTKIDDEGRKVTTLMAELEGMRTQVSSLRAELPAKGAGDVKTMRTERRAAETSSDAPHEIAPLIGSSLLPGTELFKQRKYQQANESFTSLTRSHPDDARVWYYAALARGLATRDWKGETEKLVTEGVQREIAGTPERSEIDSTFSDLTPETGKDWLAFYRRRAR